MATTAAAISRKLRAAGLPVVPKPKRYGVRVRAQSYGALVTVEDRDTYATQRLADQVQCEVESWPGYRLSGCYGVFMVGKE